MVELAWYMRNQLLRDADWAGMAHSLEIRVPMVDIGLIRKLAPMFASVNPPGKLAMAEASPTPMPESILHRRKSGFNVPVHQWTGAQGDVQGPRNWARMVYRECIKAG